MSNIQSLLQVTPKDTFYNSKKEIIENSNKMHEELLEKDRELYTFLLYFTTSTYYSKSKIITTLLGKSLYLEESSLLDELLKYEDALIHYALFNENATHAIKMLLSLKENKINNSRTTNVILDFIFNRGNADFLCIKYRNKIKQLLIHALGLSTINKILAETIEGKKLFKKHIGKYNNPYAKEIFKFVCGKVSDMPENCNSSYIKDYIKAEKVFSDTYFKPQELKGTSLPIEVLIGFNNCYKKYMDISQIITLGKSSEKQKIQLQNAVKKASNNTIEIKIDFSKYSILDLYKYLYNKEELEEFERKEVLSFIDAKAREIAEKNPEFNPVTIFKDKVAIILDLSDSTSGSTENLNNPLYKNLLLHKVLTSYDGMESSKTYNVGGKLIENKEIYLPEGDSNISKALIEAVIDGYTKIIILSDGFENVGNTENAYNKLKESFPELSVNHYNPVFSPKDFSCKTLCDDFPAIPFISENGISDMLLFTLLEKDETEFKKLIKEKIDKEILKEE